MNIYTVGFTKKSACYFFERVCGSGAVRIVDIRINNTSQLAGFAKRDDLAYFLETICGMSYVHLPVLAPTRDMLDRYRKGGVDWGWFESGFLNLMKERAIEEVVSPEVLEDSCLLCTEDSAQYCHRRLVADYLSEHWGGVEVRHL